MARQQVIAACDELDDLYGDSGYGGGLISYPAPFGGARRKRRTKRSKRRTRRGGGLMSYPAPFGGGGYNFPYGYGGARRAKSSYNEAMVLGIVNDHRLSLAKRSAALNKYWNHQATVEQIPREDRTDWKVTRIGAFADSLGPDLADYAIGKIEKGVQLQRCRQQYKQCRSGGSFGYY